MRYKRPVHQCPDCDARGNSLSSHYLATGRGKPVMGFKGIGRRSKKCHQFRTHPTHLDVSSREWIETPETYNATIRATDGHHRDSFNWMA